MSQYPFITSFVIMTIAFMLGHIIPARCYRAGLIPTIICGSVFAALSIILLWLGLVAPSALWQNVYGLCAGICAWIFYGEVLETLQGDFKVTTGVEVNYGNIPLLVVIGVILWLVIYWYKAITNHALVQMINAFYITWSLHVVLLTVYYGPVFGGEIVENGSKIAARGVWSRPRIIAALTVGAVYLVGLVPALIVILMRTESVALKTAGGFWLVILLWSALVEIPKKLVYFRLW